MLQVLHIENIAIIERADISFAPGFNALTGETGAGKSIVIDALGAVLGQRTSRDLIRTGAARAFVSAVFDGVDFTLSALADNGISPEEDGTLVLQRELYGDGKNVCRANGRPITVAQLRAIGSSLLNIHGQHDGQQLLDEEQHIVYLDSFGRVEAEKAAYGRAYEILADLRRRIQALQMDEAEKARRMDTLKYQIRELERAELQPGEEEGLNARRNFLRNSEKFTSAVSQAEYCLNGDDNGAGALNLLREAEQAIAGIRNLDGEYAALYERLESVYSEVYDLADILRDRMDSFEFSPDELDEVEGRLDLLYRLKKKYGPSVEDMLDYLERCRGELARIADADDTLALLERDRARAEADALAAGKALSAARKRAAEVLSRQILTELEQLDMGKVRFSVSFEDKPMDDSGMDRVRFLMSANVGEELRPIHKIASGGELARIMLALKNVLSEQDQVGTMVFDEVDTGVSGRAAQRVAEKMARISRKKQVLCVTHLPQIAAMADTHFSVEKGEANGRTYTSVTRLSREERRRELARITGGSRVSEVMLSGAEELLRQAETYRESL
jgi:DNA repair protein RecN (Recombination protein N)